MQPQLTDGRAGTNHGRTKDTGGGKVAPTLVVSPKFLHMENDRPTGNAASTSNQSIEKPVDHLLLPFPSFIGYTFREVHGQ